jgi:hypothetical protein
MSMKGKINDKRIFYVMKFLLIYIFVVVFYAMTCFLKLMLNPTKKTSKNSLREQT